MSAPQRRPTRRSEGGEVSSGPGLSRAPVVSPRSGRGSRSSEAGLGVLLQQPLTRQQLKRLEEHRYRSAGASLLEPLMQVWWEWLVRRLPLWMAPNAITITGLALNACTTLVLMLYCPTATEQVNVPELHTEAALCLGTASTPTRTRGYRGRVIRGSLCGV